MIAVVILTEADSLRGYGHLGRCCALYDALTELGADARLLVRGEAPNHIVEERACTVAEWASPDAATRALAAADAAVVDSYEASVETYSAIAEAVGAAAYFDDTARLVYPRGLVVNGGLAATEAMYAGSRGTTLLLGPAYQPLREEFWDTPVRETRPMLKRVLVVFGGGASGTVLGPAIDELKRANADVEFDVVTAPRSARDMRDAMLGADAAVTAAGQTLCELAKTGTPAVSVSLADNQLAQARAWDDAGASLFAGTSRDPDIAAALVRSLSALADPGVRERMSAVGPALIDGLGALRIGMALLGEALDARTRLMPATAADSEAILALSNDEAVRANSLSTEPISAEAHEAWFADRLARPESAVTLLAWDGQTLAGQVRFDLADHEAVISISVAAPYRGIGWGRRLLERAVSELRGMAPGVDMLVATVRSDNAASRRLFERSGFEPVALDGDSSAHPLGTVEYRRAV